MAIDSHLFHHFLCNAIQGEQNAIDRFSCNRSQNFID